MAAVTSVIRSSYSVFFGPASAARRNSRICSSWSARSLASTAGREVSPPASARAAAMQSASACRAVCCRNSSFMAAVTAAWISGSSRVGACLQIFLPCSSRLMHRQTYRFLPWGI